MGGMRKHLPIAFWSFIIGSAALTALPFTSGYFSKDEILLAALESERNGMLLWAGGVLGAFFTAIYSFRLVFVVFFGKCEHPVKEIAGFSMATPLVILAALALLGGYIHIPVDAVFGHGAEEEAHHVSALLHGIMIAVPILGVIVAYLFFLSKTLSAEKLAGAGAGARLHKFFFSGWGMDALYNAVFVTPFVTLARINRSDILDTISAVTISMARAANALVARSQTGLLRWYAASVVGGVIVLVAIGVLA
jgi:NADH-quinone oxidoreductase subunit L